MTEVDQIDLTVVRVQFDLVHLGTVAGVAEEVEEELAVEVADPEGANEALVDTLFQPGPELVQGHLVH